MQRNCNVHAPTSISQLQAYFTDRETVAHLREEMSCLLSGSFELNLDLTRIPEHGLLQTFGTTDLLQAADLGFLEDAGAGWQSGVAQTVFKSHLCRLLTGCPDASH